MRFNKVLFFSTAFIALMVLVSLFADWFAPYPYELQNVQNSFQSPNADYWFGTDALGRDLFSRLIYGCRVSMSIAMITALSSVIIGVVVGTLAGFIGGWFEAFVIRAIDVLYALPSFIIMILVMLVFGRDLVGIYAALTITGWLGTARLMRAQVRSWKTRPFVEAAHSLGAGPWRLIRLHIIPNCIAPIIVELSYQIPTNVLAEAFLSFLGIGIRPPTPSWGVLANEGWRALEIYPHLTIFPGLLIFLTMLSFNLIGDKLRDRLDPFVHRR